MRENSACGWNCLLYTSDAAYGRFLSLEPLTLAPFDRDTIDPSLLSDRELAQLNAYHARVYETLAPHLDAETRAWLLGVTAPLGK